ncbi:MAG: helix-turn-helix transcriptional regulator [Chitinophagales bacterium]|nr:helix-turn-helix transcriptional regulator [Chitinophagales bacterium]
MTQNNKTKRQANPIIKKILEETPQVRKLQIENRMDLSFRIYNLIKSKGYTSSSFAKKMNRNASEISKWTSGTHNFTIDTLTEIACHLGVSLADLTHPEAPKVIYRTKVEVVRIKETTSIPYSSLQGNILCGDHIVSVQTMKSSSNFVKCN